MFDIQQTIKWVTAVLQDPHGVAASYKSIDAQWRTTFIQVTLPVVVAAYAIAAIIGLLTGGSFLFGSFTFIIFSLLWGLAWGFVVAFIFDYLAGTFGGKRDFNSAYATVALAMIPASIGTAISPLPWLGWLLSIAASIYSLVLAYRFLPVFLEIPEVSRVKHFVASILVAIVINILVSLTLAQLFAPVVMSSLDTNISNSQETGIFGGVKRQADITEQALSDVYEPTGDGKLSDSQVERYANVMRKTHELRQRMDAKFENMDQKEPSVSDIFGSIGGVMRLANAEMEVVKTGDGNWAEHQWVKSQLETARIHQDLNNITNHNYKLFLEYQNEIENSE